MPRQSNLAMMSVDALLKLRDDVTGMLSRKGAELKQQLQRLEGKWISSGRGAGGGRSTKGRKVAPKYRDSQGNTWAGRGAQPKWLRAALQSGAKLEDFAIGKPGPKKGARKAGRKRGRPRKAAASAQA